MSSVAVVGAQIPANQSITGMVDLGSHKLVAIEIPDNFGGTTLSFQTKAKVENDDNVGVGEANPENWNNVYDDAGNEVTLTVAANRTVVIGTVTKAAIGALRYIRIRNGTAAAPVNTNPAMEFKLILKA